ncbi:amidophosphoribosyltransferase [Patescibacteria group bacterium]|nr:amidophosphoribosyltransferase [Patescibacteria group bacterium]
MHEKLVQHLPHLEIDKPRDKCAVIGVYSPHADNVSETAFQGLVELNHRGQEGAGIAVANGERIEVVKDSGLVQVVFNKRGLPNLPGAFVAIGQDRYSTSGSLSEMQPFKDDGIAIAHNGNLTNVRQLRERFGLPEEIDGARSDTRIALAVINSMEGTGKERILKALPLFEGAYSFVFMTKNALYAARDPNGLRPLVVGELKEGGYAVASEAVAFRSMGARFLRDVEAGEAIEINNEGLKTIKPPAKDGRFSQCIFELIYLSRPDGEVFGIPVMKFRERVGETLARHLPRNVDIIAPVPNSGRGAYMGVINYMPVRHSGARFAEVFYPNPYKNIAKGPRTFILPDGRDKAAIEKYSVVESSVRDRNVVLVDDSIVRGSMRRIVQILKSHGARSVHALIASPPIRFACYYGVDTGNGELLAHKIPDVEEIREYLGLDSLYYLSYAELLEAVLGNPVENAPEVFEKNGFCGGCFTGRYPTSIDGAIAKTASL